MSTVIHENPRGLKRTHDGETLPEQNTKIQRNNSSSLALKQAKEQAEEARRQVEAAKTQEKERLQPLEAKIVGANTSYSGCLFWIPKERIQIDDYMKLFKHIFKYAGPCHDVQELGILDMSTLKLSNQNDDLTRTGMVQILNMNGELGESQQMDLSGQVDNHFTLEQLQALKTSMHNRLILVPIYYKSVQIGREWVININNGVEKDFQLYFGGKNNANETVLETIAREVDEETGLDCCTITVKVAWSTKKNHKFWYNSSTGHSVWVEPFVKLPHQANETTKRGFKRHLNIVSTPLRLVSSSNSDPVITRVETTPGIFRPIS